MEADREEKKAKMQQLQLQRLEAQHARRLKMEKEKLQRATKKLEGMVEYHQGEGAWVYQIPESPTYYPTEDEFSDPIRYIRKIQAEASKWGICKIVPPLTPATPPALVMNKPGEKKFTFTTRHQTVQQPTWNDFETGHFLQSGRHYTLAEFEKKAGDFQKEHFGMNGTLPPKMVEAEYWRQFLHGDGLSVEYGNDVEGTAFAAPSSSDPLGSSQWNLQVLPTVEDSTLRLLPIDIPGVTSPMLYVGMLFATFAWHVEDQYLYSINYQHMGAAKTWYGVPASEADHFERVTEQIVYRNAAEAAATEGMSPEEITAAAHTALLGKTTMFSPKLLMDNKVRVSRAVQNPGEFIITFPRGYHGGFSNGFNVGEAANFAIADWFRFGADSCLRYSRLKRAPMLAQEQLLCTEAEQVQARRNSGKDTTSSAAVLPEFVSLVSRLTKDINRLEGCGAKVKAGAHASPTGIPCDFCGHVCYLAHALINGKQDVCCLRCAQSKGQLTPAEYVHCHQRLSKLRALAAAIADDMRKNRVWGSTLQMEGLTEAQRFAPSPNGTEREGSRDRSETSTVDAEGHSIPAKPAKQRPAAAKRKTHSPGSPEVEQPPASKKTRASHPRGECSLPSQAPRGAPLGSIKARSEQPTGSKAADSRPERRAASQRPAEISHRDPRAILAERLAGVGACRPDKRFLADSGASSPSDLLLGDAERSGKRRAAPKKESESSAAPAPQQGNEGQYAELKLEGAGRSGVQQAICRDPEAASRAAEEGKETVSPETPRVRQADSDTDAEDTAEPGSTEPEISDCEDEPSPAAEGLDDAPQSPERPLPPPPIPERVTAKERTAAAAKHKKGRKPALVKTSSSRQRRPPGCQKATTDLAWMLDLEGCDFGRAASTRSGSVSAVLKRHAVSWEKEWFPATTSSPSNCGGGEKLKEHPRSRR